MPRDVDSLVKALQEVPVPDAPADLSLRMATGSRRRPNFALLSLSGATALALVLTASFLGQPKESFAQVINAQNGANRYTVTYTRLGQGKKKLFTFYTYRDGNRWAEITPNSGSYGSLDGTVSYLYVKDFVNIVMYDVPRLPEGREFRVGKLLRRGAEAKFDRSVIYKGRSVNRYTVSDAYRSGGRSETYWQEVLADPKTHLPLRCQIMRDGRQWGDIWEYSYEIADPKALEPNLRPEAEVFDYRKQRPELSKALKPGTIAMVLHDCTGNVIVLARVLKVDQSAMSLQVDDLNLKGKSWMADRIKVGDESLFALRFSIPPSAWKATRSFSSGSLQIGKEALPFDGVPTMRTGMVDALLREARS